jgi:uncharacterized membrane protein
MQGFMLFLHVVGYAIWLGASLSFMVWGPAARKGSLEAWAHTWLVLGRVHRLLVAPACLVATATGIYLTMALAQSPADMGTATWLIVMEVLGLVAAVLTLAIAAPLMNRMGTLAERSLAKGAQEPQAEVVRKRLALVGSVVGVLILVSIYFAVLKPTSQG